MSSKKTSWARRSPVCAPICKRPRSCAHPCKSWRTWVTARCRCSGGTRSSSRSLLPPPVRTPGLPAFPRKTSTQPYGMIRAHRALERAVRQHLRLRQRHPRSGAGHCERACLFGGAGRHGGAHRAAGHDAGVSSTRAGMGAADTAEPASPGTNRFWSTRLKT